MHTEFSRKSRQAYFSLYDRASKYYCKNNYLSTLKDFNNTQAAIDSNKYHSEVRSERFYREKVGLNTGEAVSVRRVCLQTETIPHFGEIFRLFIYSVSVKQS